MSTQETPRGAVESWGNGPNATPVQPTAPGARVVLSDIDVPFWRLVVFLVKLALAAIPAGFIMTVVGAVLFSLAVALVRG